MTQGIDGLSQLKLIAGPASTALAAQVAQQLTDLAIDKCLLSPGQSIQLIDSDITSFSDSEVRVQINENVRGGDVFIIQSTSAPANEHLMQLLITMDALSRASVQRITAVMPYFGYARQDRKTEGRTPISAKLVANLIETAKADRVLTMDLHAGAIQGFFDIPTDNLYGETVIARDVIENYGAEDLLIISPDIGGVVRARRLARRIDQEIDKMNGGQRAHEPTRIAIVDKLRMAPGVSEAMNVIGEVAGKRCVIIDDIVDSGGTLANAADALLDRDAIEVAAYISHGVLTCDPEQNKDAVKRIEDSRLKELVITDSINQPERVVSSSRIRQISIAGLLANAILRNHKGWSISALFD